MSLLQLSDLTKNFDGLRAVDGFSLDIPDGSLNALVGPNGCGKSTLFNLITGVLKPDAGQVIFRGREITGWPPHRIARLGIGRKFQVPAIFEEMTVRENLTVAAKRSGNRVSIDHILEQIRLADRWDLSGGELAHGQKQWLEIGLLLAQAPSLILLDEPTAGMTGAETRATADLIRTINQDQGITVLVIEHDMGFIEYLSCPLHVMSKGKILKSGSFAEIRNDAEVKALYFGNTAVPADA
ncbi:MAG: ABC transporter ATP-binding protein [Sneathiella sp.]|uniref:ABC transporter ATP-binding protein n=1 Tax=Sneathiella sp. TaxID=1964365 RepID=UPI000C4E2177|nr:ABC transporter ATP-binding protein [Sneathiella sp.]MAZ02893.1 ABC transporter ATP-binding protein [Sneathiella sp.]